MLQIFRPINLFILILSQTFVSIFLLDIPIQFPNLIPYVLLAISSLCLTAGAYVVNDLYDQTIDQINKPNKTIIGKKLSAKNAWRIYAILSAISLVVSGLLGVELLILHTISGILLYLYSVYFKKIALLGNFLVAFLSALGAILPYFVFANFTSFFRAEFSQINYHAFYFLCIYSFLFSFIREILKDVEDIEGDKVGNCHTFPILFGIANTKKLVTFLCIVVTICNIFYRTTINQTLTESTAPTEYLYYLQIYLLFVMLVSSTLAVLMWKIEKPKEFRYLSLLCKILLLSGVLAIPYIAYLP